MAVATGTFRRRDKEQARLSAKSKRDKMLLAGGAVLLIAVLAFEVPKTLKTLSGSSATPPAPAASTATATTPATTGLTPATIRSDFREIARLAAKNPFKPQLGPPQAATTPQPFTSGPAVRRSHFVAKNPFKPQIGAVASTVAPPFAKSGPVISLDATSPGSSTTPTKSTTQKVATAPYGYIVILRSLASKTQAIAEVSKAHAKGLSTAAYLFSSKYTTLRKGYWVVYLAKYATPGDATAALQGARSAGYSSAYSRPVKK